ncbi:MAG TPA: glycoside hydrolase family 88 protein [Candidatus Limnocylindrales bacterium]|nr:glycoside hydrolase family 88 protein [Candidatus Limnocylindrales bacterium]
MKTILAHRTPNHLAGFLAGLTFLIEPSPLRAQPIPTPMPRPITLTASLSSAVKPYAVLTAMQRVADWQLAHSDTNRPTGWVEAAGDAGMMALAGISGDPKYREAMLAKGNANNWNLAAYQGRKYHADDQCEGQIWTELYFLYRENRMISPLRERFDFILAHPSDAPGLDFTQPHGKAQELWSWCDSLFMAPPTWLRLYTVTGDERYLDFAVTNWWRTTDYLCDKNEHLFYRDSTYFDKREANGQKIFWSRGNGWVMAGLVRALQYLPANHPDRPRFEQLFKDMAAKIVTLQQPDGLWRSSLLDPEDYPARETSGSGFFTYALAWGVNQGLLDRARFEPAVRKGWAALVECVGANGKLMHIQPVGSDPRKFAEDSTAPYGVGAFLLAGSEVYRMAVLYGATMKLGATIPLIKMENVPLFFAIQNLAHQAHIDFILDPNTGYQPTTYDLGDGRSLATASQPTVSCRWTNSTADHALRELLQQHDLRMEQDTNSGVFLISAKEAGSRRGTRHESGAISTNKISSHDLGVPRQGVIFIEQVSCPIKVTNPAGFSRHCETVDINLNNVQADRPWSTTARFAVMDGVSSRILDSQIYTPETNEDKLLFQVDLAPNETRTYYILDASALAAVPPPIVKTFARFVPERYDDFAWESDRIAHRAYGLALIPAEGTISSAPDVWIKKDRGLIVDIMYKTGHYHEDNGSFMDDYRVGHSRGCGGLGIWDGKKLYTSSNYHNWKLITTGPIRSEFELTYDAWDAGNGRKVSETKRYTIDAGSWLTRAQSTFSSDDKSPLTIGVGLAERACPTNRVEFIADDQSEGWMSYWQPEDKPKGIIGVAMVLPKDSVAAFTNDAPDMPESKLHAAVPQPTHEGYPPIRNLLAITQVNVGQPFTYYFGACWDRSGDFTNHIQWEDYVKRFAERRDQPLQVTVGN